jgi:hypothetical protein
MTASGRTEATAALTAAWEGAGYPGRPTRTFTQAGEEGSARPVDIVALGVLGEATEKGVLSRADASGPDDSDLRPDPAAMSTRYVRADGVGVTVE